MPDWLEVQLSKAVFFLTLYYSQIYEILPKLSALHLSRATAIFVVDCCQFGPVWIFGLRMELMACAGLFGGTTQQICLFTDLTL